MTATMPAKRAFQSDSMGALARWGLAARATVYLLIGLLALAIARGARRGEADQRGAMQTLVRHSGGEVLVWVIALGLAAYALWRLGEAAFGVAGEGRKVGPRLQSLARGLIYLFFAINSFKIVLGRGSGSQARQQELWTAKALQHRDGRWIVGVIGAVVVVCGLVLMWQGLTRHFEKYFELARMDRRTRRTVEVLGVIGTTARGFVFAIIGVLVVFAAVDRKPSDAGGFDVALQKLATTPAGPWLLVVVAAGLVIFGIYGFAEAKWRRV